MNETSTKQTYSKIGFSFSLGYLAYMVITYVIIFIALKVNKDLLSVNTVMMITYIVFLFIMYPLIYFLIKNLSTTKIEKKNMGIGTFLACFPITILFFFGANLIGTYINTTLGQITGQGKVDPMADILVSLSPIFKIIIVSILAPVFEELFFRKLLIDRTVKYGELQAILLSGVMFGLFHANFAQFAYAFALGVLFAFIYVKTGNIIYTIILHLTVNFMSSSITTLLTSLGLDITEMTTLAQTDMDAYTEYVYAHAEAFAIYGVYLIFLGLCCLLGLILLIVLRKKIVFKPAEQELEKGTAFKNVVCNPGMLFYIALFVILIIMAQVGFSPDMLLLKLI